MSRRIKRGNIKSPKTGLDNDKIVKRIIGYYSKKDKTAENTIGNIDGYIDGKIVEKVAKKSFGSRFQKISIKLECTLKVNYDERELLLIIEMIDG